MNDFDKACRYIVKLDPAAFYRWLLGLHVPLSFHEWYDTRTLAKPAGRDRTGDLIAFLVPLNGTVPTVAMLVEFQTENDSQMVFRLLEEIARFNREFQDRGVLVFAAVMNLTGPEQAGEFRYEMAGRPEIGLQLSVIVRTLRDESAAELLNEIETGRQSRSLLPWIPLLRDSGVPAIIEQWKRLAESEPDVARRADFGSLAGAWLRLLSIDDRIAWESMLKEYNMNESPFLKDIRIETRREDVLRVIQNRLRSSLPADLTTVVNSSNDLSVLERWLDAASVANSLDEFRAAVKP